jgi:NitT/TauT family transport system permease protein
MMAFTMSRNRLKKVMKFVVPLVFWLGVWQFAAMRVGRDLLLPSPQTVWNSLTALALTASFWLSALYTLGRVLLGLVGGVILGSLLAILTHFCGAADWLISPAVRVIRATPVVSFILLVYLWVARAQIPGVIAGLMVLPVIWGNVTAGLAGVDGQLLEMAHAYRFGRWKTLSLIYLPSLRPHFSSGLLTAFGLAWKSGVAAEVLCPPKYAIGSQIQQAKTALETPELFAWTLVLIALSLLLELLLRAVLQRRGGAR